MDLLSSLTIAALPLLNQVLYKEFAPISQGDQFDIAKAFFAPLCFTALPLLTLICAGMGSGKSALIANMHLFLLRFRENKGVIFVGEANDTLLTQIKTAIDGYCKVADSYLLVEPTGKFQSDKLSSIQVQIKDAHRKGKVPIIPIKGISRSKGGFNAEGTLAIEMFDMIKCEKLFLFDEPDSNLTELAGGLNPCVDHHKEKMNLYGELKKQIVSLNFFDKCRQYGVKVMGFSGTSNNMICSKLHSTGYLLSNISIVNFKPIMSLYMNADGTDKLKVIPMKLTFENVVPYLLEAEELKRQDEKVKAILCFSSQEQIEEFKAEYQNHFGRPISHCEVTSTKNTNLKLPASKKELNDATYVIGIEKLTVGFDINTHIPGSQFCLGILFRAMTDKSSVPLSKNGLHKLHNATPAKVAQLFNRLRKGGKFLVPENFKPKGIYNNHIQVFEEIRDGRNECLWAGPPRLVQIERFHQGTLQAIIHNLRFDKDGLAVDDRRVVQGVLDDLRKLDGRDLKKEYYDSATHTDFDAEYWIDAIGVVYDCYLIDHEGDRRTEEERVQEKNTIKKCWRERKIIQSGGGLRDAREMEAEAKKIVKARAQGICCHCGEAIEKEDDGQMCHVDRHHLGGAATPENMMYGHQDCDGLYDGSKIIHAPNGDVWVYHLYKGHNPDMKQVAGISKENILARWNWVKEQLGKKGVSDDEFTRFLTEKKYVRK